MDDYKVVTACRICKSRNLRKYLDLGEAPLANSLLATIDEKPRLYPLAVLLCEECSLSQLSIVVDPKVLYTDYAYHSSVSQTFSAHCRDMAFLAKAIWEANDYEPEEFFDSKTGLKGYLQKPDKPIVVDIAANDGALLDQFKAEGFHTWGVEPCKGLSDEAQAKGHWMVDAFWGSDAAKRVPSADVITATNVLAHVDDVVGFLTAARKKLFHRSKGFMVVEVPYIWNLLAANQFDTIYHEHLSYFTFRSLKMAFERAGMKVFRVEQHDIHGGSLRVYASPFYYKVEKSVEDLLTFEDLEGMSCLNRYLDFANKIMMIRQDVRELLGNLRSARKKVMGYGASAKGTMFLNYCGLTGLHINAIVDDTKAKQGKFVPGTGIPIIDGTWFEEVKPDYIFLFSWNFQRELRTKTADHEKRGGKYIIGIPQVQVL